MIVKCKIETIVNILQNKNEIQKKKSEKNKFCLAEKKYHVSKICMGGDDTSSFLESCGPISI